VRAQTVQREAVLVRRVDQLKRGRRDIRQDAEPGERVLAGPGREVVGRDRIAADAVKAVASRDHIAAEHPLSTLVEKAARRAVGGDVLEPHILDVEKERVARIDSRRDRVPDDLLLRVDDSPAAPGQLGHWDAVALAVEAQLEALVHEALAPQTLAQPDLAQQLDREMLEHAGARPSFDVLARLALEDDRFDPGEVKQTTQDQTGRTGPDDPHLCSPSHESIALQRPQRVLPVPPGGPP
jgi:hypothetical protein